MAAVHTVEIANRQGALARKVGMSVTAKYFHARIIVFIARPLALNRLSIGILGAGGQLVFNSLYIDSDQPVQYPANSTAFPQVMSMMEVCFEGSEALSPGVAAIVDQP
jgi:hypothetical protein